MSEIERLTDVALDAGMGDGFSFKERHRRIVCAVLQALLVPNDARNQAGALFDLSPTEAEIVWDAMINNTLNAA